jgi:error-prone DNA polymerase
VPIIHVVARRLIDRSELLDRLQLAGADTNPADRTLGRTDEVRWPNPGSAAPRPNLRRSRDFR